MSNLIKALGYLRTSSATNAGEDKDSDKRQRDAIERGAAISGHEIVEWFYDVGVSGDVAVGDRPAFTAMLDKIESNGVRTVFCESSDRFSRKMVVAELGIILLQSRGVTLLTATGEDLTNTDDEMRVAFRQIAMAFAQLEKARLVRKLKVARDRKSEQAGRRIEGQRGYVRGDADLVALAQRLKPGKTLLAVSSLLAEQGYRTREGKAFSASQVQRLLDAKSVG